MQLKQWMKTAIFSATVSVLLTLAACMTMPDYGAKRIARDKVILAAHDSLGIPYRFGGDSPKRGFDCSGLTHYAYQTSGIDIPRTAYEQYRHRQRVSDMNLRPGDLVFFKKWFHKVSHVGIYLGHGKFAHSPNKGKTVRISNLNDRYWKKRYAGAGNYF